MLVRWFHAVTHSVVVSRWKHRLRYILFAPFVYRNWWTIFVARGGRSTTVLELRNGLRYLLRPHTTDLAVVNEASILNPYLGSGYLEIPDNATVIDVGANIGDFTMQLSRLCPKGIIYAIEPVSGNCDCILEQIRLNHASNVRVRHLALGTEEGTITIHDSGGLTSVYRRTGQAETVRITNLATFMTENGVEQIDLLKLDCEGAEWDILPTAEGVLPQIRQICMEYHNGKLTADWLEKWLIANGYLVRRTSEPWNGMLWAWRP